MMYIIAFMLYLCNEALMMSEECWRIVSNKESSLDKMIVQVGKFDCAVKLVPVHKWAQNMGTLFLKVEFLTSTQTTPCEQILQYSHVALFQQIQVNALCIHQQTFLVHYHLYIKTFQGLNYNFAKWTMDGQNSMVLQCPKSPAPFFWPILHLREFAPRRRPKIWWSMLERYWDQLKQVIDKLELQDINLDKTRKMRKKEKQRSENQMESFYCWEGDPRFLGSWL